MFTRVSESLFLPATVKEAQGPSTSCIDTDSCPENKGFKKVVNRIEAGTIYSRRSEIVMVGVVIHETTNAIVEYRIVLLTIVGDQVKYLNNNLTFDSSWYFFLHFRQNLLKK